jgi:hypothetical protein
VESFPLVSIRIQQPTGSIFRSGRLTPYFAEILCADLRRSRAGRVHVLLRGDETALEAVRDRLAPLGRDEIRIVYRRRPLRPAA